jgi:hypothetical protein
MKATSFTSAPNASAITTIADAAPGDEPQTPVVPGSPPHRLSSHPSTLLTPTDANTTPRKIGQLRTKDATIAGVIVVAIRQPTTDCAARNAGRGRRIVPP